MASLKAITPFRQMNKIYNGFLTMALGAGNISKQLTEINERKMASIEERLLEINGSIAAVNESIQAREIDRESSIKVADGRVLIHEIEGLKLLLDPTSLVDRMVLETGEWEGEQVRKLISLVKSVQRRNSTIFLDLGAYWGYYSLMLYRTGMFDRIYAFDADAYNFSQLQANIFLNGLDHIIIAHHLAVSDSAGYLMVQNSHTHADGNRGATRVLTEAESIDIIGARSVRAVAVDDVLHIENSLLVIKLDVEAHEDSALRGMKQLISNNEVLIQVEIYKEQESKVIPVLNELGLRQIYGIYPDFFYTNIAHEAFGSSY